ncbi:MAG: hypothetical protein CMI62_11540 [Parvibaculum sp.]|uniref:DUF2244 domain-containing protein n=1 Tax=Parvibaculum sp. TaxID=2024848 RepID=UPI000C4E8500|nr:DUF2244 domain-containing protein [Parvibaculum sp.]MAU61345.1 hypothetical protein [Parvibaculum sp.]|tara:strand:- start:29079 stop:29633 length:555 start_codon:yes stop_codon:yes gene_type:complete
MTSANSLEAEPGIPNPAVDPLGPPLHFNALITPHRSLSMRGFTILIGIVAAVNFTAGILFMIQGAWPVLGFCGLEVLLVWWAFRANYRSARAHETVQLSDEELRIRRVDAKGNARAFSFQPYWVRVALREEPDESTHLHLLSHGRELEVAAALSPHERADFARALEAALAGLRTARLGETPQEA